MSYLLCSNSQRHKCSIHALNPQLRIQLRCRFQTHHSWRLQALRKHLNVLELEVPATRAVAAFHDNAFSLLPVWQTHIIPTRIRHAGRIAWVDTVQGSCEVDESEVFHHHRAVVTALRCSASLKLGLIRATHIRFRSTLHYEGERTLGYSMSG